MNPQAKIQWEDPNTHKIHEFMMMEGATATIGRSSNNDIQIAEHHVSRQHAVVSYRDGIFMINDLGSSNGTFVNDQKISDPYPLFAGDVIRLFVPILKFMAVSEADAKQEENQTVIHPAELNAQGSLIVTNGPQEGQTIPLLLETVTIGRATSTATWEILLQDPSVSRPHARIENHGNKWHIFDLGSSNGSKVNGQAIEGNGHTLKDGDTIKLGESVLLFRLGVPPPSEGATTTL